MVILIGLLIAGIGAGLAVGIFVGSRLLSSRRAGATAAENLRLSEEAKRGAEAIRREAQVEAREEALKLRAEVENELREKRAEMIKVEERVLAIVTNLDDPPVDLDPDARRNLRTLRRLRVDESLGQRLAG